MSIPSENRFKHLSNGSGIGSLGTTMGVLPKSTALVALAGSIRQLSTSYRAERRRQKKSPPLESVWTETTETALVAPADTIPLALSFRCGFHPQPLSKLYSTAEAAKTVRGPNACGYKDAHRSSLAWARIPYDGVGGTAPMQSARADEPSTHARNSMVS